MLAWLLCRLLHLHCLPKTLASANQHLSSSLPLLHFSSTYLPTPRSEVLAPSTWHLPDHHRSFSTNQGGQGSKGDETWKFSSEVDDPDSIFGQDEGNLSGIAEGVEDTLGSGEVAVGSHRVDAAGGSPWNGSSFGDVECDIFEGIDQEIGTKGGGRDVGWETTDGYKPWSLGEDEEKDVFGIREEVGAIEGLEGEGIDEFEKERKKEQEKLQQREKDLLSTLNGIGVFP